MRTRRSPAALVLVSIVSLSGVLAGCGSSGTDERSEGSTTTVTPTAVAAFPVTIQHALGTTEIAAKPKRIVSVGYTEQDFLLALGEIPVGVTDWYGDQPDATWPWAHDLLRGAKPAVLSQADGIQFEKVAALKPDLILGLNAGLDKDSYAKLSAIAPTIAFAKGGSAYFSQWRDMTRMIGTAVGKAEQAETLVTDIDEKFADAAKAHPEFAGKQVIFLQNAFYDGEAIAYQKGLSTDFLTDLGFDVPASLDQFVNDEDLGGQAYIPLERLSVLNEADVLIWGTEKASDRTALEKEAVYRALEEVKSGMQVFTDGGTAGAIYFSTPLSLPYVVDLLVPALADTIAGDGPVTIDATA